VIFEHLLQRGFSEQAARRLIEADRALREPRQ
jgi:hypothetical protein